MAGCGGLLLRVGDDAGNDVGVVHDLEKKTPGLGDTGLPEVVGAAVFFAWREG
jgi:hypothetical protein